MCRRFTGWYDTEEDCKAGLERHMSQLQAKEGFRREVHYKIRETPRDQWPWQMRDGLRPLQIDAWVQFMAIDNGEYRQ